MRPLTCPVAIAAALACGAAAARADDVTVAAGGTVQQAIAAAPAGSTVHLPAGTFAGRLTIAKPSTLVEAGCDRTALVADANPPGHTDAEKLALGTALDATADADAQGRAVQAYLARRVGPTLTIRAPHVTVRGLAVHGNPAADDGGVSALVELDGVADAHLADAALVGPATDGSTADVRHCLVAAVWGTGVAASGPRGGRRRGVVHLADCDVRNCYYAGVDLGPGTDRSTVQRCRISGAAWHGIRCDDASPTVAGNLIFGNARCGIYASGETAAAVRDNVFWRNEMDAVSCWFNNADTIDRNTVIDNRREGIAVLGDSRPTLSGKVIAGSPVGLELGQISGSGGDPRPAHWKPVLARRDRPDPADQTRPAAEGQRRRRPAVRRGGQG